MNNKVTILDEGYKFIWEQSELDEIELLWNTGYIPGEIANAISESYENVWLALNHLYFKGVISFER